MTGRLVAALKMLHAFCREAKVGDNGVTGKTSRGAECRLYENHTHICMKIIHFS